MSSATVRFSRGAWVVDISTRIAGKRQRTIKTFGAGGRAKAAAQAYAAEKDDPAAGLSHSRTEALEARLPGYGPRTGVPW